MARKFKRSLRSSDLKKKLAQKTSRKKAEPILSIELIRKEYLLKLRRILKNIVSKVKSLKLAN